MNDVRIPKSIRPLLHDYMGLLSDRVPDLAEAFYLHGSIALNAFNDRLSDIDFITVLRHRPTADELTHLRTIHQTIIAVQASIRTYNSS
jgi:hypothetical protein